MKALRFYPCVGFVLVFLLFGHTAFGGRTDRPFAGTPESTALLKEFPFLGRLLTAENPWEKEPWELAGILFDRTPALMQGSPEYPLLYRDQREQDGWPGERIFNQYAYEVEYYCFDRVRPVLKLHVGRPLLHSQQHGRVEEVAKSRFTVSRFPYLAPEEITPFLEKIDSLVVALQPFGAKKEDRSHYLVSDYLLPNGVRLTVTNLSGSTNGSPYVEVALAPEGLLSRLEGTQTPAFPEAEGFGCYAVGGRGGKVYVVTSLEDYLPQARRGRPEGRYGQPSAYAKTLGDGNWKPYVDALGNRHEDVGVPLLPSFPPIPAEQVIPGTLREAVEAEGPRYIVFAVSGDIELKADLVINNPYVTIAGQSAPGEGIQIKNWGIKVNAHDVVLRHMRIRVGETKGPGTLRRTMGEQTHALDVNAMNVVVDHCDIAYANDQVFNLYGANNRQATTIQWCYIYGAPTRSTHEKGNHSMMMAANGWGYVSFHHNLLAHGQRRNPRLDMLTFDYRNNVLYNFTGTGYGSDNDYLRLNYINNTLKKGPDSERTHLYAFGENTLFGQWYGEGNDLPDGFSVFECPEEVVLRNPHPVAPVHTHSAREAYRRVVAGGGATKPVRDAVTAYVSKSVADGSGFIPAVPDEWPGGGFATYAPATPRADTNRNGMPDDWEISRGLDLKTTLATGRDLHPEYDNIEMYLNSL